MKVKKIGIVGHGVVGKATASAFRGFVEEVVCYDKEERSATHTLGEALFTDLVFVCVPTPQKEGSLECDLSAVEDAFRRIKEIDEDGENNYVLRSTVPPGTTARLAREHGLKNLVHSPEFLNSRTAEHDAAHPSHLIIGRLQTSDLPDSCQNVLRRLYETRFPGVPILDLLSEESEAAKLFTNAFFAVKVAMWNEMRAFSDALGLRWDLVRDAILADGRINPCHTLVPGPDMRYGFGGMCLPKDLASFVACSMEAGKGPHVAMAAHHRNLLLDRPFRATKEERERMREEGR